MSFTTEAIKWGAGLTAAAVLVFGGLDVNASELTAELEPGPEAELEPQPSKDVLPTKSYQNLEV